MSTTLSPPKTLVEIQSWFAKTIAQPLSKEQNIPPGISDRAHEFIKPAKNLTSKERIEIYYKQYWWRLLDVLGENFPFVLRLFGYDDFFEKIAVPYLTAYPPTHWALCRLGDTLPLWIKKNYKEEDKELVLTAADIDWAAQIAFWGPSLARLDVSMAGNFSLLEEKIFLQPHLSLFALHHDFFTFRDAFLIEEPSFWQKNPFPPFPKKRGFYAVFRSPKNFTVWEELAEGEYFILSRILNGNTISQALDCLQQEEEKFVEQTAEELPHYFQKWVLYGWLTKG